MRRRIEKGVLLVLIGCLLFVSTACGYDWIWGSDWKGPYHHAAVFAEPQKTIKTSSGQVYSLLPDQVDGTQFSLWKHEGGSLELVSLHYDRTTTRVLYDIDVVDDNIYCATSYGLFLYQGEDVDLQLVIDEDIYSMVVRENCLFYVVRKISKEYEIKEYNLLTREIRFITTIAEQNDAQILTTDKGGLFIDERKNISFVDSYGEENRIDRPACVSNVTDQVMSFIIDGEIARLTTDGGKILFQYQGGIFEYELPIETVHYYYQVKTQNNMMYFSVREMADKSDCRVRDCICRYAKSWVFAFDLNEKSFSIIREIGANEQVIAFSSEYVTYCTQEAVYRNGEKIYNFPTKIEPYKQYRAINLNLIPSAYTVYIADDGKKLDVCVNDNRNFLKDEYW